MKEKLLNYLKQSNHTKLINLLNNLSKVGNIYLIGGAPRDFRIYNNFKKLRDLDITIQVKDENLWEFFLKKYKNKINCFGGYKIFCEGIYLDIWRIEDTWGIKELSKNSEKNYVLLLKQAVFLNIDGIIYDWDNDLWYDDLFQEAMNSKVLDVVLENNPQLPLNMLRVFIFKNKYDMKISENLRKLFQKEVEKYKSIKELSEFIYNKQIRRYGKVIFSREEIACQIKEFIK